MKGMDWLNYHHLYYFWTVAREGSISKATVVLGLAQPTISAQIKVFETAMGEKLFEREGRRLTLTETGRIVFRYAEEIFALGREMMDSVRDGKAGRPVRLDVGVSQVIPMLLVEVLLRPARAAWNDIHLVCREGRLPELLAALSLHEVDVVLAEQPADPSVK